MSYAINSNGDGWRAVGGAEDLVPGETFSITEPVLTPTYLQELSELNVIYTKERLDLCAAWLVAAVADGVNETERKADVEAELADLDAQHERDVDGLKAKHGVV